MEKVKLTFPQFKYKALTLSYDDGTIFDKQLIKILDEYKIKCTFNINSGMFSKNENDRPKRRLTEEEVYSLYSNTVHEVAVHGVDHLNLRDIDIKEATKDIVNDKINLERMFNHKIEGMAYAYGAYNDEVVDMLKNNGIKYSRTTISTEKFDIPTDWLRLPATCHHKNPNLMSLADEFIGNTDDNLKLFYLWGHSYEFNDSDNWYIMEDFAKKIGLRNDIWYATNMEVYDYLDAYNKLEYLNDNKTIKNNSDIDLYLKINGENIIIKAKEEYTR